jgi:hypothetical protein
MRKWAEVAGVIPSARSIDRNAGEGPPRCCARRLVSADELVCYDDLAPERLALLLKRLPHLVGVSPLYLCGACGETIIRERLVTREDRARDFGLSTAIVEKARLHDDQFRD